MIRLRPDEKHTHPTLLPEISSIVTKYDFCVKINNEIFYLFSISTAASSLHKPLIRVPGVIFDPPNLAEAPDEWTLGESGIIDHQLIVDVTSQNHLCWPIDSY